MASVAFAMLGVTANAGAQTGGATPPPDPTAPVPVTAPAGKATIGADGMAIPPSNAPPAVVAAINAGNVIRKAPYRYGGGHKSFTSAGYDCSGAVSYVLHAAGVLATPLPSGPFMRWQLAGRGPWITTYANKGHMYAVIAGLRWDTSAARDPGNTGTGPRWRATKRPAKGYVARHPVGY